jgi:hypothetical protein
MSGWIRKRQWLDLGQIRPAPGGGTGPFPSGLVPLKLRVAPFGGTTLVGACRLSAAAGGIAMAEE